MHLHVLLPLVVVERSEKVHWRSHLESKGEDRAVVVNAMKETELLVANALKRTDKPVNHTIKQKK